MTAPIHDRRGFLRGLASLPLIGGGVALIGQPTAAAVPVTDDMLATYQSWLGWERLKVLGLLHGRGNAGRRFSDLPVNDTAWHWHHDGFTFGMDLDHPLLEAGRRAPVILSAAGVPIGGDT